MSICAGVYKNIRSGNGRVPGPLHRRLRLPADIVNGNAKSTPAPEVYSPFLVDVTIFVGDPKVKQVASGILRRNSQDKGVAHGDPPRRGQELYSGGSGTDRRGTKNYGDQRVAGIIQKSHGPSFTGTCRVAEKEVVEGYDNLRPLPRPEAGNVVVVPFLVDGQEPPRRFRYGDVEGVTSENRTIEKVRPYLGGIVGKGVETMQIVPCGVLYLQIKGVDRGVCRADGVGNNKEKKKSFDAQRRSHDVEYRA